MREADVSLSKEALISHISVQSDLYFHYSLHRKFNIPFSCILNFKTCQLELAVWVLLKH